MTFSTQLLTYLSSSKVSPANSSRSSFETPRAQPQWMPNVERPTGFNDVSEIPGMIYTDGGRGAGCDDVLKNKVLWTVLE